MMLLTTCMKLEDTVSDPNTERGIDYCFPHMWILTGEFIKRQ